MISSITPVTSIGTGADTGFALMPDGSAVLHGTGLYSIADGSQTQALSLQGSVGAVDPSGARALALFEETILLFDIAGGQQAGEFRGSLNPPVHVAFSPQGNTFVSAGDRYARIWDVQSAKTLHKLKKHESQTSRARFSPDGSRVVSISNGDYEVKVWDAAQGNCLHTLVMPQHEGNAPWMDVPQDVAWSADGSTLLVAANYLVLWDAASGQMSSEVESQGGFYAGVVGMPGGQGCIATVFYMEGDQISKVLLRALDVSGGNVTAEAQISAAGNLTLTADGSRLVASAVDTLDVYSLA